MLGLTLEVLQILSLLGIFGQGNLVSILFFSEVMDDLEVIGTVELYPCKLWKLAPAGTLEDIYEEITDNPRVGKLRLVDTYELVKEVIEKL
ncbi:MAG: hypothetical protein E6450_05460 [Streptococcus salivarius]|nr:hypothetical protein [Streptococcus salivarius]